MASENLTAALYANCFRIGHNDTEFILEACQAYEDDQAVVMCRLAITPHTARELYRLLGISLQEYERLNEPGQGKGR